MLIRILLLSFLCLPKCFPFKTPNREWRRTFVDPIILIPSPILFVERHSASGLVYCNLRANQISWAHLMCFIRGQCIVSNLPIYPTLIPTELIFSEGCYTDLVLFPASIVIPATIPVSVDTTSEESSTKATSTESTQVTTVPTATNQTATTAVLPNTTTASDEISITEILLNSTTAPTTPTTALTATTIVTTTKVKGFAVVRAKEYQAALDACASQYNGLAFVPKSQKDFDFLAEKVRDALNMYTFYPLTDIDKEGTPVYQDGVPMADAPYNPDLLTAAVTNTEAFDCTSLIQSGEGGQTTMKWVPCAQATQYNLLCTY